LAEDLEEALLVLPKPEVEANSRAIEAKKIALLYRLFINSRLKYDKNSARTRRVSQSDTI
jgi:hypothetical protein